MWMRIAPLIIGTLAKIPVLGSRYKHLDEAINHSIKMSVLDAPKPNGTVIKMQEVVFIDFFRVEDFPKVKAGLRRMQRRYKSAFPFRDSEDSFSQFEKHEAGGSGWMEFDSLSIGEDKKGHLAERVLIHLYWISPSFLVLALIVDPSSIFHESFEKVITKDFADQIHCSPSVVWSALRKKSWRVSHAHGAMQREAALNKLMFDLNHEVSSIVHRNIGKGWTIMGPLPTIEILTLESGDLPEPNTNERHFWGSIGIELANFFTYHRDGVTLFRQENDRKKLFTGYKVLVEAKKFMTGKSTDGYASPASALRHHLLYDHLAGYFVAVGIREHLVRLVQNITQIRREIAPELTASEPIFFWQKLGRRMSLNMAWLNQIKFEIRRTEIEIDLKKLRIYPINDLKGFISEWRSGEKREFLDDLRFELERQWSYADAQLKSLRENYRDKFDFNMQKAVLTLTIITAALAALSLPDSVYKWVSDGIGLLHEAVKIVTDSLKKLIELIEFFVSR